MFTLEGKIKKVIPVKVMEETVSDKEGRVAHRSSVNEVCRDRLA